MPDTRPIDVVRRLIAAADALEAVHAHLDDARNFLRGHRAPGAQEAFDSVAAAQDAISADLHALIEHAVRMTARMPPPPLAPETTYVPRNDDEDLDEADYPF